MGIEENLATLPLTNRISDVLRDLDHKMADFPVEYVENGPVMENQQFGDDVDLGCTGRISSSRSQANRKDENSRP